MEMKISYNNKEIQAIGLSLYVHIQFLLVQNFSIPGADPGFSKGGGGGPKLNQGRDWTAFLPAPFYLSKNIFKNFPQLSPIQNLRRSHTNTSILCCDVNSDKVHCVIMQLYGFALNCS